MNGKKTTSTAECNHESFCFKLNPIDWGVWGMSNNSNQKIFIKILILCFHFPVKLKREQHQKNKLKLFVVWNELFSSFIRFFFLLLLLLVFYILFRVNGFCSLSMNVGKPFWKCTHIQISNSMWQNVVCFIAFYTQIIKLVCA